MIRVEYMGCGGNGIVVDKTNLYKIINVATTKDVISRQINSNRDDVCFKVLWSKSSYEDERDAIKLLGGMDTFYVPDLVFTIEGRFNIKAKKGFDVKYIKVPTLYLIGMHKLEHVEYLEDQEWQQCHRNLQEQLIELHTRGILHRDIKPENIMYNTQAQKFTLIDFGYATDSLEDANGDLKGTIEFMSPALIDLCYKTDSKPDEIKKIHWLEARRQGRGVDMYHHDMWVPCDKFYRTHALETYTNMPRSKPIVYDDAITKGILFYNDWFALGLSLLELYAPNKTTGICSPQVTTHGGKVQILRKPREITYINKKPHVMIKNKWVPLKAARALDEKVESMLSSIIGLS